MLHTRRHDERSNPAPTATILSHGASTPKHASHSQHHPHEDAAGAEALGAAGGRHDSDRVPCGEGAKPGTGAEGEDGLVVGGDLDRERT